MGRVRLSYLILSLTVLYLINCDSDNNVATCPKKCTCVRNTVRCLHQDLQKIPKTPTDIHTLDLRFNKIYEIPPGAFKHMHLLRSLLMNDNSIEILHSGVFHGLHRLKYLYLYRNHIRHIDSNVFQGLHHLEQLYLHVNEIQEIEPETFSHLPKIERLYLHNNRLKRIPPGSFRGLPKLRKLRLDSNALVCDCSMLWLVRMVNEHSDMKVAATCYGPKNAMGTSLATMSEQDFHCYSPIIEQAPEDVEVNFGDDAMFTCVAIGEPEPEVIWLRDSSHLPLDSNRYEIMDNGTLMVHEADENDIGVFECMAKNQAGEARSKPANLIIKNKRASNAETLVFTTLPRNQLARLNQLNVSFDCVAQGNPKPHLIWLFNGERILINERILMHKNGTIFIKKTQESDAGNYSCQAENVHEKIVVSATLEIMVAPAFIVVPKDVTAAVGDKVEFQCEARGVPTPIMTWYINTLPIPETENIVLGNENKTLTILVVTPDDEAIYHCRAENSEGLTEISVMLTVEEFKVITPRIISKPEDTEAYRETTVQLPCEVESEPPASIEWRKGGVKVTTDDRVIISIVGNLVINNLTLLDTGYYECTIFNEYGRDTASMFLLVKDQTLPGDEYINIALTEATRDVDQAIERTIKELFTSKSPKNVHELFTVTRFPNAPARQIARAAEIYERTLDKVKTFIESGLKVTSVEPFNYKHVLSNSQLALIARLSGCTVHREEKDCSDMCFHNKYRNIDGTCNNFEQPMWGGSLTGFRRILPPVYENGFSQPVGWNKNLKHNGFVLPGARLISTTLISTDKISEDVKITHMVMQWGQWLDHDLDHSLPAVSSQTWDGVDCKKTCDYAAPCFPIDVPPKDPRVTNRRCIDFVRTSSICGSGMTSVLFETLQPREQVNQLTSFLDASQVYGFEKAVAEDLRDLTNENGLLRVGAEFPDKKPLLPTLGLNGMDCRRNLGESNRNCFVAGDIRANEQIGLAAMHTIWMREHNRVALGLKAINPFWDGDKVYFEARKIVGAEMQHITYAHWLPLIIGPDGYKMLGEYKEYDSNINPSISNVFATAALRFGHTLINPILHRLDENFDPIPQGHLKLRDAFFAPWRLVDEGGVDPLMRGMFMTPAKLKTPSQNLNSELTEKLFHSAHAVALDLAAINIQRGRDHGIPSYTKFRQFCNMSEVNSFDDLKNEISDEDVRSKLKELYGSVQNIDVWVGGVLEDQVEGGKVGPLFRCLLIEQFQRLRDGDRHWYENPTMFNRDKLKQIKQMSLARILCDNGDNIDTVGENVFLLPELQGGLMSCDALPSIDFRYWADCDVCDDCSERPKRRVRRAAASTPQIIDNFSKEYKRLNNIENAQNEFGKTVDLLKKRIKLLEDSCQKN